MSKFANYKPVRSVIETGGFGHFVTSIGSWSYHKRMHRRALEASGIVVFGGGRRCDMVDPSRVEEIVKIIAGAARASKSTQVAHPRLFIDSLNEAQSERTAKDLRAGPEREVAGELGYLQALLRRLCSRLAPLNAPLEPALIRRRIP